MGRFLRIGLVRDGQVLEERLVSMGADVTVGKAPGNTFVVAQGDLPKSSLVFKARGPDRHALQFTNPNGRVDLGTGDPATLSELVKSGVAERKEKPGASGPAATFYALPLPNNARGKFDVGDVTVLFHYVERDLVLSKAAQGPRPMVLETVLSWEGTVLSTKILNPLRPLVIGPGPQCDLQLPGRVLEARSFQVIGGGDGRFFVDLRNPFMTVTAFEATSDEKGKGGERPGERHAIKGPFTMSIALREGFSLDLRYAQALARPSSSPFDIQDPLPFLSLAGSALFHAAIMLLAFAVGQGLLAPNEVKAAKAERRRELQVMLQEQKVEAKVDEDKKADKKSEEQKKDEPKEEAKKPEPRPEPKAAPKPPREADAGAATPGAHTQHLRSEVIKSTFLGVLGGVGESGDSALPVGRETQFADAFQGVATGYAVNGAGNDGLAPPGPKTGSDNGTPYVTLTADERGGRNIETTAVNSGEKGAGEEKAVRVNVRTGSLGAEGGVGKIDNNAVAAVFGRRKGAITQCYEKELRRNPSLKGRITLRFTIGTSGRVTNIAASQNTTGDEAIASCIISKVQGWKFDAPAGGAVTFTYPFILEAR